MKTSFRKLRGLGLHKHDPGDVKFPPLAPLDELVKASKDMEDMTDCYDNLLSAAAAVANSAYEFSVSLQEMGACFLQRIALSDDEEAGEALMILGKVQFEIQKLVNNYRSHIFKTITVPSESLLNELQIVEEMKRQCDEKRELYESMRTKQKEKGRSKGESFSPQQLEAAREEFDEEATLLVFRLKSLKEGQTRSLLTQASRHYAAQLSFFRKALNSLEAVEPHVKFLTEHQHIEYHFSGLDNDESEDGKPVEGDDTESENDNDSGNKSLDDEEELNFDHHRDDDLCSHSCAFRNSIEENLEVGPDLMGKEEKPMSQSAPLVPPREVDPAERMTQFRPSLINKFHAYALPKPGGAAAHGKINKHVVDDEAEKIHRHSFSGPLTAKPITRPVKRSSYGTLPSQQMKSNELHELPKPPPSHLSYHHPPPPPPPGFVGYSAPLMSSRNPEKRPSAPLALPTPPLPVKSSSIPFESSTKQTYG